MRTRLVVIGLALLGSGALGATLSVTAIAQPVLPRVVQSSDGSLYVVQGPNAWPLLPDQIDDAELGSLNLGSEVDGTLPAALLSAAAPAPPPPPAPLEPPPPTDAAPPAPDDTTPQVLATPVPDALPPPALRRGVPTAAPAATVGTAGGASKRPAAGPTPTPAPYSR